MEAKELGPENIPLPPSPPFDLTHLRVSHKSPLDESSVESLARFEEPPEISLPDALSVLSNVSTTPSISPRSQSPARNSLRPPQTAMHSAPPMQRAYSSPGFDSSGNFITPASVITRRPPSPLGQYGRRRSPLRSAIDETYPTTPSWSGLNIEPNIPEHEELDISAAHYPLSSVAENDEFQPSPIASFHNTFPRRRRPTSPLHPSASAPSLNVRAISPNIASGGSSPSLIAQKYAYEPYPTYSLGSASSMPSTPTSFRSRSPSISSLETIEDTPDAEEAARIEEEEMARARAEESENGGVEGRRRSSLEGRSGGLRSNKERKRWSVCGAERRADFSLEPIEE